MGSLQTLNMNLDYYSPVRGMVRFDLWQRVSIYCSSKMCDLENYSPGTGLLDSTCMSRGPSEFVSSAALQHVNPVSQDLRPRGLGMLRSLRSQCDHYQPPHATWLQSRRLSTRETFGVVRGVRYDRVFGTLAVSLHRKLTDNSAAWYLRA